MLALYTEAQLGAAYQIYARIHAENNLDVVDFETFRNIFVMRSYLSTPLARF